MDQEYGFDTLAVRVGHHRTQEGEHSEPIFLTSSFVFASAAEAAARFSGDDPGNIYSRFTNPTVQVFEQRLAALEGGKRCVATASGMSAIFGTCIALLEKGNHVICSRGVFGTTTVLFERYLGKFGVEVTFVSLTHVEEWQAAFQPNTRMLFLETPSNPLTEVADLAAVAELAHSHNSLLVVDNCFCTPALQRPFEFGADIVIHSATKFLDGQGRCLGGAAISQDEALGEALYGFLRTAGPSLSAFNAWVFLKGLETLSLRMQRHSDTATALAVWLEKQPAVARVYYPGLASHPQHALAKQQQSQYGGLLSFELKGGQDQAWRFIDSTQLLSITANLGDSKSTVTHPATTTHGRLSPEQRQQAGIADSLVRIAVGLEEEQDLKADLQRGLEGSSLKN